MNALRWLVLALSALTSTGGVQATTNTVIDLPTAIPTRILDIRPANPVANIVSIPGADGVYGIIGNGLPATMLGMCDAVARNAFAYADHGLAVVLVDRRDSDIGAVLSYLDSRDHLPIWIVSGSAATAVVVALGASVPAQIPLGLIIWSPTPSDPALAAKITRPTQVVYHADDSFAGVNATAPVLYGSLTSAVVRELVVFGGGMQGGDCLGYHTFVGLDADWIATTTGFIAKYTGILSAAHEVPVVEYFNASQGHYFMTADADEIAGLDGGAFGGALARTGLGFNAWSAPSTGTVPVCRFFTTPGRFGTKGSHFYTANAAECEWLKGNPDWIYEKIAFHIQVPVAGACGAATAPVYRMFNHGQTGAPNHRFTTDLAQYDDFVATKGWDAEGIAFCSPA